MDICEKLKGENKLQQEQYGRGLHVLDESIEEITRLRDLRDMIFIAYREWKSQPECLCCEQIGQIINEYENLSASE